MSPMSDPTLDESVVFINWVDIGADEAASSTEKQAKKEHKAKKAPAAKADKKAKKVDGKAAKNKPAEMKSRAMASEPAAKKEKKVKEEIKVHEVDAWKLEFTPLEENACLEVPKLAYGLDRCLFKPGVYPIQDTRTGVFNFDPYLAKIMPVEDFDFSALKGFVSSSEDNTLLDITRKHEKKYCGSTSSMSAMLMQLHYLLSAWRPFNAAHTSRGFVSDSSNYTRILRAPATIFLRHRDGVYAVDADKQFDSANVLSMLGKSLEKFLTLPREDYEKYHKSNSHQVTDEMKEKDMDSFHFTNLGDFILRSQLDAHDPRLPSTGMFDIKTRAVLSIRMDSRPEGYKRGLGYELHQRFGQFESFEREYFDMIRAAFLKYSLQVRMGRMDGIFVAFHNTRRMFGFQYIPLEELDVALHGTHNTMLGDQEFRLSLHILNDLMNRATARFPGQSLRIHVETRPTNPPLMYFFAKPIAEEAIDAAQKRSRADVEKFERQMTNAAVQQATADGVNEEEDVPNAEDGELGELGQEESLEGLSVSAWIEMSRKVDEAVMNDELGVEYVRDNIEEALEQSGLVAGKSQGEITEWVNKLLALLTNRGRGDSSATAVLDEGLEEEDTEEREDGEEIESEGKEDDLDEDREDQEDDEVQESEENELTQADAEEESTTEFVEDTQTGESTTEYAQEEERGVDDPVDSGGSTLEEHLEEEGSQEMTERGNAEEAELFDKILEDTTPMAGEGAVEQGNEDDELVAVEAAKLLEEADMGEAGEAEETQEPAEQEGGSTESAPKPSLKELILRLAEQVEDKPSALIAEAEEELEGSQAKKLKGFKRALAELLAESRGDSATNQPSQQTNVDDPVAQDADAKPSPSGPTKGSDHPAVVGDVDQLLSEMDVESTASNELLGMILTIRNKVDGKYVDRPDFGTEKDHRWHLEYSVRTLEDDRAQKLYAQLKARRRKMLSTSAWEQWDLMFGGALPRLSKAGFRRRKALDSKAKTKPVLVYGEEKPSTWEEIFGEKKH